MESTVKRREFIGLTAALSVTGCLSSDHARSAGFSSIRKPDPVTEPRIIGTNAAGAIPHGLDIDTAPFRRGFSGWTTLQIHIVNDGLPGTISVQILIFNTEHRVIIRLERMPEFDAGERRRINIPIEIPETADYYRVEVDPHT